MPGARETVRSSIIIIEVVLWSQSIRQSAAEIAHHETLHWNLGMRNPKTESPASCIVAMISVETSIETIASRNHRF